jgi:hypothetical protein
MSQQATTSDATQRWLTNSQMRSALAVLEELLGRNGRAAVLHFAGLERYAEQLPPDDDRPEIPRGDITSLFAGIVSMFGDQGARGVMRRWGRAFAARRMERRVGLRLLRLALRLASPDRSVRYILSRLLHHLDLTRDGRPPELEDRGDYFLLELTDCVYCHSQNPAQPGCPAVVGLVEGLLRWASGGDYDVTEERSLTPGGTLIKIRKRPLGRR